jgi:hypothetical protein
MPTNYTTMLKKYLLLIMLMASFQYTYAQTSVNSSGGDISVAAGSLALSIGQTTYKAIEDGTSLASQIQGVQIPFEYYLQYCPEDINRDGIVDILDFLELNSAFSTTCTCREDINRSGEVNVEDFITFNSAYGDICPASP